MHHLATGKCYYITVIYAACNVGDRRDLWKSIRGLAPASSPWMLMGDFNAITSSSEKMGGNEPNQLFMVEFNDYISDCNLEDVGYIGSTFTWTSGRVSERLDRVLCDQQCLNEFPLMHVRHLAKNYSDHSPLLLEIMLDTGQPRGSFRFQNMWLGRLEINED
ncbi:hypothetical protein LIER_44028 [Lithospermum erythrorhizon]|uniref:Endonuclease/exonuclease/phosphatase domain-containing protein n=1 Tax=Lithospermum erythrorhizon TaxID=34254 RepID=A0AAV3RM15_LITER